MIDNLIGKTLALGIILIVIGGLFVPCSQSSLKQIQKNQLSINEQIGSSAEDTTITCYIGGAPYTKKISYESGSHLKELFDELAIANAHDPNSFETQQFQQRILLYAEKQGLLPAGISAEKILTQLGKIRQGIAIRLSQGPALLDAGTSHQFFCNFVSTGEGSAFPIIILPRFIPIIMAPIPRLFIGWKTLLGITSCGGLLSRTGFIASGPQQGVALGFWGIGFSIFLPPVMAYGMFGYALYAKVTAAEMEYWPPNNPPKITTTYPLDGATHVPLSITELSFHISDLDGDLMGYSVTTSPDIGGGNGNLKPDGTYTIPVSDLQGLTTYSWHIKVTDGKDTTEQTATFTTEAVAPIISNPIPEDTERDVPMNLPQLQFTLKDNQGDTMEYTVQTSPNIGSDHKTDVHDGTYTVPISGMTYGSIYHWYVNVTDGMYWTRKIFSFSTGYPSPFDPFEYDWQYRKQILINHTLVTDDLEDFPVLLSTTDPDLMKAQIDGDDILFMNGAGSAVKLRHELEEFNRETGTLIAWVKIPSMSAEEDTVFYLYYGNPSCINQEYPEKTWDSGYEAVWHMNDVTSVLVPDSTSNEYTGTKRAPNEPQEISGKIGAGQEFDGTNDNIWINGHSVLGTGDKTISIWMKIDANNDFQTILTNALGGSYKNEGLEMAVDYGMNMTVSIGNGDSTNAYLIIFKKPIPDYTTYHFYTARQSGANLSLYLDGNLYGWTTTTTGLESLPSHNMSIGRSHQNSPYFYWFDGRLDEIRMSSIARSSSWIQTEYYNQNSPSTFLTFGPEESEP